jgi:hypothetical protein
MAAMSIFLFGFAKGATNDSNLMITNSSKSLGHYLKT